MKFEYEDKKKDKPEPVGALCLFNGGPKLCLAVQAGDGKTVWFYESQEFASVQSTPFPSEDPDTVKLFYPGDKITITF